MTAIATPTTSTSTSNGAVIFLDSSLQAAQQAGLDVASFAAEESGGGSGELAVAAGLGAAAAIASAVFAAGNLAVNVANSVNNGSSGQLQLDLVNYSSYPVIVYDYNPSSANVTDVPTPLGPGDNDVFVLTLGEEFSTSSSLVLNLLIGSGTTSSIQTAFTYSYTDEGNPGRWAVKANIDGTSHTFPNTLQLFGLTFTGNSGYPSFSVYTSSIETASGALALSVYNLS